jgi:hypothetical protein
MGLEFGLDQSRAPVRVRRSAALRHSPSRTSTCEEIKHGEGFCKVSVTPLNSAATPLLVIQKHRVVLAKSAQARAQALFSSSGPTWAGCGPTLFLSFSFFARAKEILENCRK